MELSQGCPIDCDTCVWVRVFHYSLIVVVYKSWRKSMHYNEVECFYYFKYILHTEYTAKLYLNTKTWTDVWSLHFQVLFICHVTKQQLTVPTLGCCCVCDRWGPTGWYSIDRVDSCSGTVRRKLTLFQVSFLSPMISMQCEEKDFKTSLWV